MSPRHWVTLLEAMWKGQWWLSVQNVYLSAVSLHAFFLRFLSVLTYLLFYF